MGDVDDFRRHHLSEWMPKPWARLAHETAEEYEREATSREVWVDAYGRRLQAPRMMPVGLPEGYRSGFHRLFDLRAERSYEKAVELGFDSTLVRWRYMVKLAARFTADRRPDERTGEAAWRSSS